MVLQIVDITAILAILGIVLGPLYALFISLNKSFHNINREIGELRVGQQYTMAKMEELVKICEELKRETKEG